MRVRFETHQHHNVCEMVFGPGRASRPATAGICCDNGPEFTSRHMLAWCEERKIELMHIQLGRPTQNGRVERFDGKFRDECLNANWFVTLMDARQKVERW